ncbi:MAG TPA: ABC transporter ATP-binding protein [Terriglobales bacterium]|nr:ABC transporter ATP-binding protein [Terriglobales bacterium]
MEVTALSLKYQTQAGEVEALRDVSFSIAPGEFVSIVGPSGCGKSTLLSAIAGLVGPYSGEIEVAGGRSSIGYMLQRDHLFEWRTIWRNALLGLEVRGTLTPETEEFARGLLQTYGLWEFKDSYPRQLSGGMRQRAALIRTLATSPSVLLLDEAFSALDYQTRLAVTEDIAGIIRREGVTTLLVTHDISEAVSLSDRIIVLTPRPGHVRGIHAIEMPNESPRERRNDPAFRTYFNVIWKELGDDVA